MVTRQSRIIPFLLAALMLLTVACSLSTIQFNGDSARVTVKLKEDQVNTLLSKQADESEDFLFDEITRVDMQPDLLRVYGTYQQKDGSTAEGSYDVALSTSESRLKAEITAVNMEGVTLNDPRIQDVNKEIAEDLERSYNESNGEVQFESITITEDSMTIIVNTEWNRK